MQRVDSWDLQSLHVLQGCLSFQQECRSARAGGEGRGLHRGSGLRSTGRGTCLGSVATGGGGGTACTGPAGMTATLRAASPPQGDNRYGGKVKLPTRRLQRNGKMAATQRKAAEASEHTSGPAPRPWRTSHPAARARRRATLLPWQRSGRAAKGFEGSQEPQTPWGKFCEPARHRAEAAAATPETGELNSPRGPGRFSLPATASCFQAPSTPVFLPAWPVILKNFPPIRPVAVESHLTTPLVPFFFSAPPPPSLQSPSPQLPGVSSHWPLF